MTRKQQAGLGQETGPSSRPETVLVRALMPLWAGWELVAPGTVYEQPADAAAVSSTPLTPPTIHPV